MRKGNTQFSTSNQGGLFDKRERNTGNDKASSGFLEGGRYLTGLLQ